MKNTVNTFAESYAKMNNLKVETELDVTYIMYDNDGRFSLLAWIGKAHRAAHNYYFLSEKTREDYLQKVISRRQAFWDSKEERKQEKLIRKKEAIKTFEVGDILYTMWGYDQTNVDFYQIIEKKNSSVIIREIAKRTTEDGFMSGHTTALKDEFTGEPMLKRINSEYLTITSYSSASLWDGQPVHCSWYH